MCYVVLGGKKPFSVASGTGFLFVPEYASYGEVYYVDWEGLCIRYFKDGALMWVVYYGSREELEERARLLAEVCVELK